MHARYRWLQALVFAASLVMLALGSAARADPPSRVARLGYIDGPVSFSPAGEDYWIGASVNRPLTTGDRLWTDAGERAEVQFGGSVLRMDSGTGVSILNLDDQVAQVQLTQGRLNVRARYLEPGQTFEVDTPNLAFVVRQPGEYRIEVDPDGRTTTILVRQGQGEVYGEGASYIVDSRQTYRFVGNRLRTDDYFETTGFDEFDRWSSDRDHRYDRSASARYVSQDVVGYQDLDDNGTWRRDAAYGTVWIPNRVPVGWAPYTYGHWAWIDPWGWTWIDDAPWGFVVSHYGRWTNLGGTWGWVPGPTRERAYYAPALVVFLGGSNFQLRMSSGNVGGIAWFPLGPRDVYRPSYPVSRDYFEHVNRSNTVINNTVINNYYGNSNVTNVVYSNRQVPGAVVAVPRAAFEQSQPVARTAVRVSQDVIVSGPVDVAPAVAPTEKSVRGSAAQRNRPPAQVFERPVVARTAPPDAPVGFAVQQRQLTEKPGKPLSESERKQLKREAAVHAPVVKVIEQAPASPPARMAPPAPQSQEPRGKSGQQGKGNQRGQPVAPQPESSQPVIQPQAPPAAESRRAIEPQAPPSAESRPVVEPQAAPPPAERQRNVQPQAAPAPPVEAVPEQHGKSGQQGKGNQHGQPVAPPAAAPPQPTTPPIDAIPPAQATSPAVAVPAPVTPEVVPPVDEKKKHKKKDGEELPPADEGSPKE